MTSYLQDVIQTITPSNNPIQIITLSQTQTNLTFPGSFMPGTEFFANTIVVNSLNDSNYIVLPDARAVASGTDAIIINEGANLFTIVDNLGNAVITDIISGAIWNLILRDNSTQGGAWIFFQNGATTSGAQASLLAGDGLEANPITNRLDSQPPVTTLSSLPVELDKSYQATFINWIGNTGAVNLPPADVTPGGISNGYWFTIKNSTTANGTLTLNAPAGGTIDGQANLILTQSQSATLQFDGINNYITSSLIGSSYSQSVIIGPLGIRVLNGSAINPSYSFINFPSTGFYTTGDQDISATCSGTRIAAFTPVGIDVFSDGVFLNGDNILFYNGIYP